MMATLMMIFGGVALGMAARRTRETGVRIAPGSGIPTAAAMTKLLSVLYGGTSYIPARGAVVWN